LAVNEVNPNKFTDTGTCWGSQAHHQPTLFKSAKVVTTNIMQYQYADGVIEEGRQ
jgi:hypothetical protein